ncbi:hypothetical protein ACVOMV_09750 [Mesorhizobium atlanticum]
MSLYGSSARGGRAHARGHSRAACRPATLPAMVCSDQFVFVHAGIRPGIALEAQDEGDLLNIREEFFEAAHQLDRWVAHGRRDRRRPDARRAPASTSTPAPSRRARRLDRARGSSANAGPAAVVTGTSARHLG